MAEVDGKTLQEKAREWLDAHVPLQFLGSEMEAPGTTTVDQGQMQQLLAEFAQQCIDEAVKEERLYKLLREICRNAYACAFQHCETDSEPCGQCANCRADKVLGYNWQDGITAIRARGEKGKP